MAIGIYYAHIRPILISWEAGLPSPRYWGRRARPPQTAPTSTFPTAPRRVQPLYNPDGPSVLVCASASTDADAQPIAVGLARVLEWKLTNLPVLYAQLPDGFNDRVARQLGVPQPLMLSRAKALEFADFVGHNFAVYGEVKRRGGNYTVTLRLLDVTQEKDVGAPLTLRGTVADLLKQEGAAVLEIARRTLDAHNRDRSNAQTQPTIDRQKLALDGVQEEWLKTSAVMQPEVLTLLGTTSSFARPPDDALLARLQQLAPQLPLVSVWQMRALQRKGLEGEAQSLGKTLAQQHPDLPSVRFAYLQLLRDGELPQPQQQPGVLMSPEDMERYRAWSEWRNSVSKESQTLPDGLRQSLRGVLSDPMGGSVSMGWELPNENIPYLAQNLNPRAPALYLVPTNRPERDVQQFEEARRAHRPLSADELCRASRAFAQMGNHARAKQLIRAALPQIPSGPFRPSASASPIIVSGDGSVQEERLFAWAAGFRRAKAYEEELLFCEEAVRRERHPAALNAAAVCCYLLGRRDGARAYWREIVGKYSQDTRSTMDGWTKNALSGLALIRMDEGDVEDAISLYAAGSLNTTTYFGNVPYLRDLWTRRMHAALARIPETARERFPAASPETDKEKVNGSASQ